MTKIGSMIVSRDDSGNLRISAAHRGGIIRQAPERVVIERADVADLIECLRIENAKLKDES